MKLNKFKVENVKSIKSSGNCYLAGDNITIFAGQNESGKTAILHALNFFGNGDFDGFAKSVPLKKDVYVACTFSLTKDECDEVAKIDPIFKKILSEINFFELFREREDQKTSGIRTSLETDNEVSQLFSDKEIEAFIKQKKTSQTQEALEPSEGSATTLATEEEIAEERNNILQRFEDELVKRVPKFVLYDNTFYNLLPDRVTFEAAKNNTAVLDYETITGINFNELATTQDHLYKEHELEGSSKVLSTNFNEFWTQGLIEDEAKNYAIKATCGDGHISFTLRRDDDTQPLYPQQRSHGTQWFISFFLRLKAHSIETQRENIVLLIDEPGTGLHEKAQLDVKRVLEDLASKGIEVLYTTHHPQLIDTENHFNRIRLVHRVEGEGTLVHTPAQFSACNKKTDTDTLSPIRTAMGLSPLSLNLEMQQVILEGVSDKFYLDAMAMLLCPDNKYCFIGCSGANQVPNVYTILFGWGYVNSKIIVDKIASDTKKSFEALKAKFSFDESWIESNYNELIVDGIEDLFSASFYQKIILGHDSVETGKKNSKLAKDRSKKELDARIFFENVIKGHVKASDLDKNTRSNFEAVFDWIDSSNKA